MKGLKVILWICAIGCLLGFVGAALPWDIITAWYRWTGATPPTGDPITVFAFRLFLAISGIIGIFFVILAGNPLKHGAMLLLAAYGLLAFGVFCFMGGMRYHMPMCTYVGDFIFGIVAGVLILVFRRAALRANSA